VSKPRKRPKKKALGWGGRRPGAGRPKKLDAGATHLARPIVSGRSPVHVWWIAKADLPSLRSRPLTKVIRDAIAIGQDRFGCRVAVFAVSNDRIDLICEASDAAALARCLQGLAIRMAKQLNGCLDRKGRVWVERYRQAVLKNDKQVAAVLRGVGAKRWKDAAGARSAVLVRALGRD
jgi:hypothetical protein